MANEDRQSPSPFVNGWETNLPLDNTWVAVDIPLYTEGIQGLFRSIYIERPQQKNDTIRTYIFLTSYITGFIQIFMANFCPQSRITLRHKTMGDWETDLLWEHTDVQARSIGDDYEIYTVPFIGKQVFR